MGPHSKDCAHLARIYSEDLNALEQRSSAAPKRLASGEIARVNRSFLRCGHCGLSAAVCQCTGVGIGSDLVLVGLPAPEENSTAAQMVRRYCSIVAAFPQMHGERVWRWFESICCRILLLLDKCADGLRRSLQCYFYTHEGSDSDCQHEFLDFLRISGHCQLKPQEREFSQSGQLRYAASVALEIFLMGDWSCLSMLDCSLLLKCLEVACEFEFENQLLHSEYMTIHTVIKTIMHVLSRMRSIFGVRIALENKRNPELAGTFMLETGTNAGTVYGLECFQYPASLNNVPIFVTGKYERTVFPSAERRDLVKKVVFRSAVEKRGCDDSVEKLDDMYFMELKANVPYTVDAD